MIIDVHQHPLLFKPLCNTDEKKKARIIDQAYFKCGCPPVERAVQLNKVNGIDKAVLLPHDFTTWNGDRIENSEMKVLMDSFGDAFYCFASVDPLREDAAEITKQALCEYDLAGLVLHTDVQHIFPTDKRLEPLYEICCSLNKPIIFHSGLSWQPASISSYTEPVRFEPLAAAMPNLRFCLAHVGFPWIAETAALLAKYPNVYCDTSVLYFDSTDESYNYVFGKAMDFTWLDRGIRHQVMFGSNNTRWGSKRMLQTVEKLNVREETRELILNTNALEFLGEKAVDWIS